MLTTVSVFIGVHLEFHEMTSFCLLGWQLKAGEVHTSSQKAIDEYITKLKQLQDNLTATKGAMNKAVKKASDDLTRANGDRASKMAEAQKTLADAQSTWKLKIKDAQVDVAHSRCRSLRLSFPLEKIGPSQRKHVARLW